MLQSQGHDDVRGGAWTLVCALLVAAVLLTAAVAKLTTGSGLVDRLIGGPEIVIAAMVLIFRRRWLTWVGVLLLFSAFAGYSAHALYRGQHCGCFGTWRIPGRVTMAMDLFGVAIGLALSSRPGRALGALGALGTFAAGASAIGLGVAVVTSDPPPEAFGDQTGQTTVDSLLGLPWMQDVAADSGGPAWLLYIYNPECHICQEHLPPMATYEQDRAADGVLRVRTISMERLELEANIPMWAWDETPTTLLIERGAVTKAYSANDLPDPATLRGVISGEADPVTMLLRLDMMRDVVTDQSDLAWLVYIYNPTCPLCLDHLAVMQAYTMERPGDDTLRIKLVSMLELSDRLGIPMYEWPSVPTTLLVRQGRIEKQYDAESTPDPVELWLDLAR